MEEEMNADILAEVETEVSKSDVKFEASSPVSNVVTIIW